MLPKPGFQYRCEPGRVSRVVHIVGRKWKRLYRLQWFSTSSWGSKRRMVVCEDACAVNKDWDVQLWAVYSKPIKIITSFAAATKFFCNESHLAKNVPLPTNSTQPLKHVAIIWHNMHLQNTAAEQWLDLFSMNYCVPPKPLEFLASGHFKAVGVSHLLNISRELRRSQAFVKWYLF